MKFWVLARHDMIFGMWHETKHDTSGVAYACNITNRSVRVSVHITKRYLIIFQESGHC
jgi:hypothetical protein